MICYSGADTFKLRN